MSGRPEIPASLQRQLMIEVGYKCSIPACGVTHPLEIDHIEDWANVKEHRYENLIVLCANHHALKGGVGPRALNVASLRVVKRNQMEVNGRYGDVERRIIDYFVDRPEQLTVFLPGDFDVLLMRLLEAGLLEKPLHLDGTMVVSIEPDNPDAVYDPDHPDMGALLVTRQGYQLTAAGSEYVSAIREARDVSN